MTRSNRKVKEQKSAIETFFADAFCIDGKAELIHDKGFAISGVVRLTDSKRGTFYIAKVVPSLPVKRNEKSGV